MVSTTPFTIDGSPMHSKTNNCGGRPPIALRPPSISASSTMGDAILLGACLNGLQGFRGPLGWEQAEAAGTNNVVSNATSVDIAHREPGSRLPRSQRRRQFEDIFIMYYH